MTKMRMFLHRSHSADGLVHVEQKPRCLTLVLVFTVTSMKDSLKIKGVKLNRGNCKIDRWFLINGKMIFEGKPEAQNPYPVTLKFGQSAAFQTSCDAIEAKVDTDQGAETLTWNKR